jgi:hypothetical protein
MWGGKRNDKPCSLGVGGGAALRRRACRFVWQCGVERKPVGADPGSTRCGRRGDFERGRWSSRVPSNGKHAARIPRGSRPGVRSGMTTTKNTAIPFLTGDERCWARGTTPVCRDLAIGDLNARHDAEPDGVAATGIDAMHRLCNGSLLPGSIRAPVAAYWAEWPLGALLEGLVHWRSRSRISAAAVLCIAPARYVSLSSQVILRL